MPVTDSHQEPLMGMMQSSSITTPQSSPMIVPVSCSQEALHPAQTYDWSDFPIIGHSSVSFPSTYSTNGFHSDNSHGAIAMGALQRHTSSTRTHQQVMAVLSSLPSAVPSQACDETPDLVSVSSSDSSLSSEPPSPRTSSTSSLSKSSQEDNLGNRKKVSFSSILVIHSLPVILGDHPCCLGGMALQSGWEDSSNQEESTEIVDFDVYERFSSKRRQAELRLSYSARRQRLVEATGLTGSELLQKEYEMACGVNDDEEQV